MRSGPTLIDVLLAELDDAALDVLAERLAPRLATHLQTGGTPGPWFDTAGAADYLATTRGRLYDLVQLGKLSPRRDGRRLLFRRDELDDYLAGA